MSKKDFWEGYEPEPVKPAQPCCMNYAAGTTCFSDPRIDCPHLQPAQQEPVAWMGLLREARDNCKASIVEEGISASRKEYRIDLEARLTAAINTSPPAQRTWVGLTPEQAVDLYKATETDNRMVLIDAIEAKLKEKNNG